jgi:uncharacterized membrane protein
MVIPVAFRLRPVALRLRRVFLTGLVVVVPIWGTVMILTTLFATLDSALVDLLGPAVISSIPGLGLLTLLLLILVAGIFASNFLGVRLLKASEAALLRVPGLRSIYSTFKSLTDIFSFLDRGRENRVVLIPFPREGLYALGLMIGEAPAQLQRSPLGRLRLIFVPTAPHPFTGYLALVLEHELISLSMGFDDAMKMEFSCGLYLPTASLPSQ